MNDKVEDIMHEKNDISEIVENRNAFIESKLHLREKKLVDFRKKLILAPLTTLGNLPFRRICKGFGADITIGEMAMADQLLLGKASEWALLRRHSCEDIFGVQVCGNHTDIMAKCAELLETEVSVDFVDINCGCPLDALCKRGLGAGILERPRRIQAIVARMDRILSCPVTVKLRIGKDEKRPTVHHNVFPYLEGWGVAAVTLHGRSKQQRYQKQANWDYIQQCAALTSVPTIGNGDIYSFEDANTVFSETNKISSVMIGRGAIIKPWIFTEIKEQRHWDISSSERFELLKQFVDFGLYHWGTDSHGVSRTRIALLEWLSFLCRYIPVGLWEVLPPKINVRPPLGIYGRNDLETLMLSNNSKDWIKISEMLLGKVDEDFVFIPKHKSNSYEAEG